ncbi:MAG: hypothetical protein ABID38_03410, partial [Candidatus Diapherotrites archaeon]
STQSGFQSRNALLQLLIFLDKFKLKFSVLGHNSKTKNYYFSFSVSRYVPKRTILLSRLMKKNNKTWTLNKSWASVQAALWTQ